ncbi:MAG: CorA family divalent cation transporter [bacterium]|nr:CorA family divalent cation transporter [bacterium]
MKYILNRRLSAVEGNCINPGETIVEIIYSDEYDKRYRNEYHHEVLMENLKSIQYCKVEMLRNCIIGTLLIPDKDNLTDGEFGLGFYIHKNHLVFIDDTMKMKAVLENLPEIKSPENTPAARFFLEFLEYIVKDDVIFLQKYEDKLVAIEEELLDNDIDDFHREILKCRREILVLNSYYQQLMDMAESMSENKNYIFNHEDCRLFNVYEERVERMYDNTKLLREYTIQMREMYQSQIDISQNQTMKVLTVLTAIFSPLTLITGWYGMNFSVMPETAWKYGYLLAVVICIIAVTAEIIYFKKKKWFD